MIPFADLPATFLGQPVRWERADPATMGVYGTGFPLGRLGVFVHVDARQPIAVANVSFLIRRGVVLFTFHGKGSLAEIDAATRKFLISTATTLGEVAVVVGEFVVAPETPTPQPSGLVQGN